MALPKPLDGVLPPRLPTAVVEPTTVQGVGDLRIRQLLIDERSDRFERLVGGCPKRRSPGAGDGEVTDGTGSPEHLDACHALRNVNRGQGYPLHQHAQEVLAVDVC